MKTILGTPTASGMDDGPPVGARRIDAARDELEHAWDLLYATDEYQVLGLDDTETKVSVPDVSLLLRTTSGSKTPNAVRTVGTRTVEPRRT